ncbi:hypothetical protein ACS0TY_001559 [Phlomoides rotata]
MRRLTLHSVTIASPLLSTRHRRVAVPVPLLNRPCAAPSPKCCNPPCTAPSPINLSPSKVKGGGISFPGSLQLLGFCVFCRLGNGAGGTFPIPVPANQTGKNYSPFPTQPGNPSPRGFPIPRFNFF